MKMIGRKIGQYKVMAELGVGGMAVVYKAVQESLDRLVAIKELKTDLGKDKSLVERFEREARSVAALTHHNIVHMYDYLERFGSKFMVMEFVEGIDLAELIGRIGRLPTDIAAIIALDLAKALEYAHFHGVIHRDIKPSNVMISKQGDVKLMDFGIARHEALGDLTVPGTALGTPAYMSPEQIMGQKVDHRSDIFSFGIVLYQMLTGVKPFVEDDETSVMQKIMLGDYVRPRKLCADIPRGLQAIVRACLRTDPAKRFLTTERLRQELERYCARNISVNYSGRLVVFLRNRELISDSEAKTYVRSDLLADERFSGIDLLEAPPRRRPLVAATIALLGALVVGSAGALGAVELGLLPAERLTFVPGLVAEVEVSTKPWSAVYLAGRERPLLDTRLGTSLYLLPGTYDLILKNPLCEPETITLLVDRREPTKISRRLRSCSNPPK